MMQLKLPKYLHEFLVNQANENNVSVQALIRNELIKHMNSVKEINNEVQTLR